MKRALTSGFLTLLTLVGCGSSHAITVDENDPSPDPAAYVIDASEGNVQRMGATRTTCADGVARQRCAIDDVDLSTGDLSSDEQRLARDELHDGNAFVLGHLEASSNSGARLVITRVFVRVHAAQSLVNARVPSEVPVVLHRSPCPVEARPCLWVRADALGAREPGSESHSAGLDLSFVGLALEAVAPRLDHEGLVVQGRVVGDVFVVSGVYEPVGRFRGASPI